MNPTCPHKFCNSSHFIVKDGSYFRKNDSKKVQRYRCKNCGNRFSQSTGTLEAYQKKRRVNHHVFIQYCSNVSMARIAMNLGINPKTVARKIEYLGKKARLEQKEFLKKLKNEKVTHMQMDDLVTIEHTKMKPLTVKTAVDADRRFILGMKVGKLPASGHLAKKSRDKYGKRENQNKKTIDELCSQIQNVIHPQALIRTDQHRLYPQAIKRYFNQCVHERYKSKRARDYGQGELKKGGYDPLFSINHLFADLRAHVSRLIRRTWNTTKKMSRLQDHLDMYISFYNFVYLKKKGIKLSSS